MKFFVDVVFAVQFDWLLEISKFLRMQRSVICEIVPVLGFTTRGQYSLYLGFMFTPYEYDSEDG